MVNIAVKTLYRIELTDEELRIIGLGLCGRLTEKHKEEAEKLNKDILCAKLHSHKQHSQLVENALKSLE